MTVFDAAAACRGPCRCQLTLSLFLSPPLYLSLMLTLILILPLQS